MRNPNESPRGGQWLLSSSMLHSVSIRYWLWCQYVNPEKRSSLLNCSFFLHFYTHSPHAHTPHTNESKNKALGLTPIIQNPQHREYYSNFTVTLWERLSIEVHSDLIWFDDKCVHWSHTTLCKHVNRSFGTNDAWLTCLYYKPWLLDSPCKIPFFSSQIFKGYFKNN